MHTNVLVLFHWICKINIKIFIYNFLKCKRAKDQYMDYINRQIIFNVETVKLKRYMLLLCMCVCMSVFVCFSVFENQPPSECPTMITGFALSKTNP